MPESKKMKVSAKLEQSSEQKRNLRLSWSPIDKFRSHSNSLSDSDSEFEDRYSDPDLDDDDDIYQDVDNIYDAPSLRATVMTSQQGMDVSQSNLAPLDEGSPFS
jgi:hypothetical protein